MPSYPYPRKSAFSPDGDKVAVSLGSRGVAVVSLSSGTELWSNNAKEFSASVAYSPDGTRVASGYDDGDICIWNAATGALLLTISGGYTARWTLRVPALTYTVDGGRLISGWGFPQVIVWNATTGTLLKKLDQPTQYFPPPMCHQMGCTSRVWLLPIRASLTPLTSTKLSDYSLHKTILIVKYTNGFSFNHDWSKLVAVGKGSMRVYMVESGNLAESYTMPTSETGAVSYSHKSDIIITAEWSSNAGVHLWDHLATPAPATPAPATAAPETPAPATPAPPSPSPATPAPGTPLPPTPTPVPVSCVEADTVAGVCRAGASRHCVLLIQHSGRVLSVGYSPDGTQIAAGGSDGVVRVFSAATGAQLRSLGCGGFAAHDVAFSPDGGRIAAGGVGGRAVLCDATTGAVLLELEQGAAGAGPVRRVRFSPDGRLVVVAGAGQVTRVYDAVAGVRPHQIVYRHAREVAFVPPAAGGGGSVARVAAVMAMVHAEADEAVHVFAVDNGEQDAAVVSVGARVTALSFSPGGDELARGMDDGTVRVGLWAGSSAASERLRLQHASGIVFDVQHSPDGRLVAAAGVGPVAVWGTSTGAPVAALLGHTGGVHRLSFSPNGTRVATAGHHGQLLVWDVSGL